MRTPRRVARKLRSVPDKVRTVVDGRSATGVSLAEIERAIGEKPGEDSLFRRQFVLFEAEEVLGALASEPKPSSRVLILHARLATAKRDWESAIARWERVRQEVRGRSDTAMLQIAVAHRESGDLAAARETLSELDADALGDRHHKELAKLIEREGAWLSAHLVDRALTSFEQEADERVPATLLSAACLTRGMRADLAERLAPLFADLREPAASARQAPTGGSQDVDPAVTGPSAGTASPARAAEDHRADEGEAVRVAVPSGLGWSGSGALTDYLRQFDDAVFPFGNTELTSFRTPYGVAAVFEGLRSGDPAAYRRGVATFLLSGVVGLGSLREPATLEGRKVQNGSLLRAFEDDRASAEGMVDLARELLARLDAVDVTAADAEGELQGVFRAFFGGVVALGAPEGRVSVINNCVNGLTLQWLRLLPGARAYVLFRDPRDQFVAQLHEGNRLHKMDSAAFIKKARNYLRSYEEAVADDRLAAQITRVQFEEFVLCSEAREAIREELGLTSSAAPDGRRAFDPEVSAQNIGIHAQHERREDIEHIERELGDYLIDVEALRARA